MLWSPENGSVSEVALTLNGAELFSMAELFLGMISSGWSLESVTDHVSFLRTYERERVGGGKLISLYMSYSRCAIVTWCMGIGTRSTIQALKSWEW